MKTVQTIYREPFSVGTPTTCQFRVGATVEEMVNKTPGLPADFRQHGSVRLNHAGESYEVPRALWGMVKPKAPVTITLHAPIRGGGEGGGGKEVIAVIAAIGLAVVTAGIAGGALAGTGLAGVLPFSVAAGSVGAAAIAAGVSIAGSLLIGALMQPPALAGAAGAGFDRDANGAASAAGNILEQNGPIPRVIGTRKVFPPLAGEPLAFYDGEDEYVEAVYVLAGPHDLSDIRVDGTPIEDTPDIEFEVREGWSDDLPLTLVTRQARNTSPQVELSNHKVLDDNKNTLQSITSIPSPHGFSTRVAPDQFELGLVFPQGLSKDGAETTKLMVPLRIRIRRKGDVSWVNLPEIHYSRARLNQIRTTICFKFQSGEAGVLPVLQDTGWVESRSSVPGQTDAPATSGWTADTYFYDGVGDTYGTTSNTATTGVENVQLGEDTATFFLDTATFPTGIYEVEVTRGAAVNRANFTSSSYQYSGNVRDFFTYVESGGSPVIPLSRSNLVDTLVAVRATSIWEDTPVKQVGLAIIAIKAKNRRVEKLSTLASGYVQDWSGTAWDNYVITSNPAPHYRDVLFGQYNLDPIPGALLDDASLLDWRTDCATLGYACDHIAEGDRVDDLLRIIAGCGYARPYNSEIWGVVQDYDRSAEAPIQVFSPRNSRGLTIDKAFNRFPAGLRANYPSGSGDYNNAQVIVYWEDAGSPQVEQITYEGIIDGDKAAARARYDLGQTRLRSAFYKLTAPVESVICRRGDLVGIQHDILYRHAGTARIQSVVMNGAGGITGLVLDGDVPVYNTDDMLAVADMLAVDDMQEVGRTTGAAIRQTDGTITVHQVTGNPGWTDELTLAVPVPFATTAGGPFDPAQIPEIDIGCLVTVGEYGQEYRRVLVYDVMPGPDLTASLTFVDEAPELWS